MIFRLQSEKCPYCGDESGECVLELEEAPTFQSIGKEKEKDFVGKVLGKEPSSRQAFIFYKNICKGRNETK